jgi:mono/diheme cytochrome c family protein
LQRSLLFSGRTAGFSFLAAGIALLALAGCHSTPPSKPLSELTPMEMQGYAVFQSHCAVCHYANREAALRGPGLQGLFKKKYLHSGAPANDDRVRAAILHGRGVMPAFGNVLDDQQVQDLLAYLHTL